MNHIFISYQHEDADFAGILKFRLEAEGFEVWIDTSKLIGGSDWRTEIDSGITEASALIVVMTPEAKASEYVTYEWAYALGAGVRVITVMRKQTKLHPRLESHQYLDFTHETLRPWDKLNAALNEAMKKVSTGKILYLQDSKIKLSAFQASGDWVEFTPLKNNKLMISLSRISFNGSILSYHGENFDEKGELISYFGGTLIDMDNDILRFHYSNRDIKSDYFVQGENTLKFSELDSQGKWNILEATARDYAKKELFEYWGRRANQDESSIMRGFDANANKVLIQNLYKDYLSKIIKRQTQANESGTIDTIRGRKKRTAKPNQKRKPSE